MSLSKFTKITEEGALFSSPFDGEPTMLTVRYLYLNKDEALLTFPTAHSQRRVCPFNIRSVLI